MTKSDVFSSKFYWRSGVGSEIRKRVTRCACNIRGSEKDYTRPCRPNGPILYPRAFSSLERAKAICRTCGTRARENQLICVTAHRKLPWKRTGCAEGVLGRDDAEALSPLCGFFFFYPTDMSNAGCITIYCPISEFTVRVYGPSFSLPFASLFLRFAASSRRPSTRRRVFRVPGHNENRASERDVKFIY